MKNSYIVIAVVVILVLGVGGYLLLNNQSATRNTQNTVNQTQETGTQNNPTTPETSDSTGSASATEGTIKEFTVDGNNFKFAPTTLTVNKGDTVRITFRNTGGTHDLVIDEFNIKTQTLNGNSQEIVEFVADKSGDFEFYCSVGSHRQMGMKGTLTVI